MPIYKITPQDVVGLQVKKPQHPGVVKADSGL